MPVAGIRGHRPTKIFVITTGGRLDMICASAVLWVSVRTWGRWTRWLPQNIVTIAAMILFVAGVAQLWVSGQWRGLYGAFNVVALGLICALLEWRSHQLRSLSGHMTELDYLTVVRARGAAGMRPVAVGISAFSITSTTWNYSTGQLFTDAAFLAWLWGLYTVTMGRSLPPKKAKRRMHLPSLPKLLLPRLAPTP